MPCDKNCCVCENEELFCRGFKSFYLWNIRKYHNRICRLLIYHTFADFSLILQKVERVGLFLSPQDSTRRHHRMFILIFSFSLFDQYHPKSLSPFFRVTLSLSLSVSILWPWKSTTKFSLDKGCNKTPFFNSPYVNKFFMLRHSTKKLMGWK